MDTRHDENDYCDLEPGKICDNCCKCIEREGEAYRTVLAEFEDLLALTDTVCDLEENDAAEFDDGGIPAMDIDPALLAEWEEKLRAAEEESREKDAAPPIKALHGSRPKRR